jgi:hypothetical protein
LVPRAILFSSTNHPPHQSALYQTTLFSPSSAPLKITWHTDVPDLRARYGVGNDLT